MIKAAPILPTHTYAVLPANAPTVAPALNIKQK